VHQMRWKRGASDAFKTAGEDATPPADREGELCKEQEIQASLIERPGKATKTSTTPNISPGSHSVRRCLLSTATILHTPSAIRKVKPMKQNTGSNRAPQRPRESVR
jgi:hypothetical protein